MALNGIRVLSPASGEQFDEAGYLAANPDVAARVADGTFSSAREHFDRYGGAEARKQLSSARVAELRTRKMARLRPFLREDMDHVWRDDVVDYLTAELRDVADLSVSTNVSGHAYDGIVMEVVERFSDGLVLDFGAGARDVYYENVVNFEIETYPSTDVIGIGERLPFADATFDAVVSIAVLEHVKRPWIAASEIMRVLKPGGLLRCCVPFLWVRHGYPNHYFNMTREGLRSLFEPGMEIDREEVTYGLKPILGLNILLETWARALPPDARESFLSLTVRDLASGWEHLVQEPFVTQLPEESVVDLAGGNYIWASKPSAAAA